MNKNKKPRMLVAMERMTLIAENAGSATARRIIESFQNSGRVIILDIMNQIQEEMYVEAKYNIHALRGAASNVDAIFLAAYLKDLEERCVSQNPDKEKLLKAVRDVPNLLSQTAEAFLDMLSAKEVKKNSKR